MRVVIKQHRSATTRRRGRSEGVKFGDGREYPYTPEVMSGSGILLVLWRSQSLILLFIVLLLLLSLSLFALVCVSYYVLFNCCSAIRLLSCKCAIKLSDPNTARKRGYDVARGDANSIRRRWGCRSIKFSNHRQLVGFVDIKRCLCQLTRVAWSDLSRLSTMSVVWYVQQGHHTADCWQSVPRRGALLARPQPLRCLQGALVWVSAATARRECSVRLSVVRGLCRDIGANSADTQRAELLRRDGKVDCLRLYGSNGRIAEMAMSISNLSTCSWPCLRESEDCCWITDVCRGKVWMASPSSVEVRSIPASATSVSYVRLQAGLVRENVSLPDSGQELGTSVTPPSDQALLAFIGDAADSFVSRRVSWV